MGILGLFWLDRDPRSRTSGALWIPSIWFLLACSRPLSAWWNLGEIQKESVAPVSALLAEGSPIDRAVYTGLLVLGLIVLAQRKNITIKTVRSCWPVALFFGYCLLSLLWSDFADIAFKRWTKAVGDWVMVMIIWTDPNPLAALKRVVARTAYIVIPVSILFIKYFGDIGRSYDYLGFVHYSGVTREKNTLGSLCLLFGLATTWAIINLWREKRPGRSRQLTVQIVILLMILWMFTILDAMTSLSSFCVAMMVLLAGGLKTIKKNKAAIHCLVAVAIVVPVSVAILGFSPGAIQQLGRNPTLTDRTGIWEGVIRITPSPLVGAGFESFWMGPRLERIVAEVTHWWYPNQAHSGYIETYANLGWVGLTCLGVVILWGYGRIIDIWRRNQPEGNLMLAWFIAGVIYNLTEAAFFRMMIPIWLFLLIAITVPRASAKVPRRDTKAKLSKEAQTPAVVIREKEPANMLARYGTGTATP